MRLLFNNEERTMLAKDFLRRKNKCSATWQRRLQLQFRGQTANQETALLPHKRAKSYKTPWTLADYAKAAA